MWSTASAPASAMTLPTAPCAPVWAMMPPSFGQSACASAGSDAARPPASASGPDQCLEDVHAFSPLSFELFGSLEFRTGEAALSLSGLSASGRSAPSDPAGRSSSVSTSSRPTRIAWIAPPCAWYCGGSTETMNAPEKVHRPQTTKVPSDGAVVAAAAADDQHGPDLEGHDRQELAGAGGADEAGVERAGQAHQHRAQHEAVSRKRTTFLPSAAQAASSSRRPRSTRPQGECSSACRRPRSQRRAGPAP